MDQVGRVFVVLGLVLVAVGIFLTFGPRLPFRLGRLPLDFQIHRGNFSFYFPLGTSILVSVVLMLVATLLNRR